MPAGFNVSELLELAILLVAVGAISGFLAGVFGIGGGAILVPVFYECFRLCACRFASEPPLPSSFPPRSDPIAAIAPAARWIWRSFACGGCRSCSAWSPAA